MTGKVSVTGKKILQGIDERRDRKAGGYKKENLSVVLRASQRSKTQNRILISL